jgi:hypothetical protein
VPDENPQRCGWVGCSNPSVASLDQRPLCVEHFLRAAQRRLTTIEASVNKQAGDRDVPADIQTVLSEMVSQVPTVVASTRLLNPELREKFMVLSETAARLYKQARRPPRFDRSVPCQIRVSVLSSETPLRVSTLNVSQRGASVETTHPFQTTQVVTLQREDTGKRVSAKVVWVKKAAKGFAVGLEILDHEDFWGLQQLAASPLQSHPVTAKSTPPPKKSK